MDWGGLFEYLGAGGGLLVLLNWVVNLPTLLRKGRNERKDASVYMAEKDNERIIELYDQIREFQDRLACLEGSLVKMVACSHYDRCPARYQLQNYKDKYFRSARPGMEQKGIRYPRSNPCSEHCGIEDSGERPP